MGLIQNLVGSVTGNLADQYQEYFSCESLPNTIFMKRGQKVVNGRASNNGDSNIISNGSKIIVYDGQGIITTDNGRIVDVVTEPGAYTFDKSSQPSIFFDKNIGENLKKSLLETWERFKYGGQPSNEQRVFFFNTKQIQAIPFGTPSPQMFSFVSAITGAVPFDLHIRFSGTLDLKIVNPILFYKEITGNAQEYTLNQFEQAYKSKLIDNIVEAFSSLGEAGEIRPSQLNRNRTAVGKQIDDKLSEEWIPNYGIDILAVNFINIDVPQEDLNKLNAATEKYNDAFAQNVAENRAAQVGDNYGASMKKASGTSGNLMGAMLGMGFGQQMNNNMQQGIAGVGMAQQNQAQGIKCPNCGAINNSGKFCNECGSKLTTATWKCPKCGAENTGKYCNECGEKKPE